MEKLDMNMLLELYEADEDVLVSIFMPTYKKGAEVNQSRIQLKNLLKEAEQKLTEKEFGNREIEGLLKPAFSILEDSLFWQNQENGLGLFLSKAGMKNFKLPITPKEATVVSNRYYIKPLINSITSNEVIDVLTLSQSKIKLYEQNQNGIKELNVPEIDRLVEDFIPANELHQEATSPKGAASGYGAHMHGYNEMSQTEKNEILKHLRAVDKEVSKVLKDSDNPLVIFSVDYIYPMYKEVSSYPRILDDFVKGSPADLSIGDIRKKTWELYAPKLEKVREEQLQKLEALLGKESNLVSDDGSDIVEASYKGNIDTLFIADDLELWGTFDKETGKAIIDNKEDKGHVDLTDTAAVKALENRAKVLVLPKEKLPALKPMLAIKRY